MTNFVNPDVTGPPGIIKRGLKKIRCRPHLINDCPAKAGLAFESSWQADPLVKSGLSIRFARWWRGRIVDT
ncbi:MULTISPECIES: hypothetical protein [unclassified Streptosporangium]|uniref:hypothetical protein n=1 Tax=unclassified Streptosporangium TaxID=2632669 RepID=UPI002E27C025|nr:MULTISPECIES: hypothetical protein [unclassified Streptosporangium]